jgi:hypothetical protein
MSLERVLNEKTIKMRHSLLSEHLNAHECGQLNESDSAQFKQIFSKYYTPDDTSTKFDAANISNISIIRDTWNNKCFSIQVDNVWYPTSIKRLSGSNRGEKLNLVRALRNAIEPQIQTFRITHPLNPTDICPITHNTLHEDAEVDHIIPFHIIKDEWLAKYSGKIGYSYDLGKMNYILHEPWCKSWCDYHLEKATLRWVSKEGNKTAHKCYSSPLLPQ